MISQFRLFYLSMMLISSWPCNKTVILESHPKNSCHPIRQYCRCLYLGLSHIVVMCLVLQPTNLWNRLPADIRNVSFENLNLFYKHTCSGWLLQMNNDYCLNLLFSFLLNDYLGYQCTASLNGSCSKGALLNIHLLLLLPSKR